MNSTEIPASILPDQASRFANLPVEILIEIEKKLKENYQNAFQRQKEKTKFGKLCLSTREASIGWKEVAVCDHKMGELVKTLKETGSGGEINSITITSRSMFSFYGSLAPSVDFGELMKSCINLKQLHIVNSELTGGNNALNGVIALKENGIELSHLSLRNVDQRINFSAFSSVLNQRHLSHIVLQTLPGEPVLPPSRFLSVELQYLAGTTSSQLAEFLEPSIGFITDLSVEDLFLFDTDENEITFALFKSLGTSLTRFRIDCRFPLGRPVPSLTLSLIANVEEIIFEKYCSFDADIFPVLSNLPNLKSLSFGCSQAISPNESDWPFLEFIKKCPSLKFLEIFRAPDWDCDSCSDEEVVDLNDHILARWEELVEFSESKFTLRWIEKRF